MTSSRKALVLILFFWLPAVILFLSSESGEIRDLRLREDAREDAVRDMVGRIRSESGKSPEMFVDPDVLPVAGEEELYDVSSGNSVTDGIAQDEHAKSGSSLDVGSSSEGGGSSDGHNTSDGSSRRLRAYGTIVIPSIDCELPLWDGAGKVELRYGAGRMPGSSEAGAQGNLVIFGHRMRRYGSIFNRLGEVSIGDSIVIEHSGQASYMVRMSFRHRIFLPRPPDRPPGPEVKYLFQSRAHPRCSKARRLRLSGPAACR